MQNIYRVITGLFLTFATHIVLAEQVIDAKETRMEDAPEVGKHVMANVDASSMILSLFMVLAVILISAFVLKRFNFVQKNTSQMNVVASLSLGAKERLIVVQVGEQQMVLGVTQQQITLIEKLAEPLIKPSQNNAALTTNVLAFLQQGRGKVNADSIKNNRK